MVTLALARKTLRDVRISTLAVGVVALAVALIDVLIYPQYRETLSEAEFGEAFRGFLGEAESFAAPEGFVNAEFFSWIPLLLITVAIIGGTGATAGEEGTGTLDFLLSHPLTRRRLMFEKSGALALAVAVAAMASYPGFLIGKVFVDFDLGPRPLLAATLNMLPVTFVYLGLSLLAGATLPGRGSAALVAIGAVVAAYFLNAIGAAVDFLEVPRKLSPFYWADASHVLVGGFDWARAGGLLAVAGIFLALATWSFEHRDISPGGREWSWRRALHRAASPATS